MGIGVDFDHRAGGRGRVDDRVQVDGIAVSGQQADRPVGWPSMVTRGLDAARDQPSRHLVARQAEQRVNARDHVIKTVEQVVGIVERAIGQDVALGSLEEAKLAAERLVERIDFRPLLVDPLDGKPPGVSRGPRVIGDPEVLHAPGLRGLGHFGQGGAAVAIVGMAVKRAGQVGQLDQVGEPAGQGGLDLAGILPQLGGDIRQPQRLE